VETTESVSVAESCGFAAELNDAEAPTDTKMLGAALSLSVLRRISIPIRLHVVDDRLSLISIAAGISMPISDCVPAIRKLLGMRGGIQVFGADVVQLVAH
jgi:hypothetical protein